MAHRESTLFKTAEWIVTALAVTLSWLLIFLSDVGHGSITGFRNANAIVRTNYHRYEAVLSAPGSSTAHAAAAEAIKAEIDAENVQPVQPVHPVHPVHPNAQPPAFIAALRATIPPDINQQDVVFMHPEGPGDKWYIVTVGRRVGVFRHWTNVGPLVLGSAHSVYQRVDSYEEGLRQFNEAVLENNVRIL